MWIPKPIGQMFLFWGFTTGDKSIQNERLVESLRNGSVKQKIAYLEELIAEDGSFEPLPGFRWSRTVVLNPGKRDQRYRIQPKLSEPEADFILNHEASRIDEKRKHAIVPVSKMKQHPNSKIAQNILKIIKTSRCHLLDDEVALAEGLGLVMNVYPEHITVYEETRRISLKWVAKTKSKNDAIRWALLALPNCSKKKKKVEGWLAARPEEVVRVQKQLQLTKLYKQVEVGGPGGI
jgi:hypothetical protein